MRPLSPPKPPNRKAWLRHALAIVDFRHPWAALDAFLQKIWRHENFALTLRRKYKVAWPSG